jgi:hypothetical protein
MSRNVRLLAATSTVVAGIVFGVAVMWEAQSVLGVCVVAAWVALPPCLATFLPVGRNTQVLTIGYAVVFDSAILLYVSLCHGACAPQGDWAGVFVLYGICVGTLCLLPGIGLGLVRLVRSGLVRLIRSWRAR